MNVKSVVLNAKLVSNKQIYAQNVSNLKNICSKINVFQPKYAYKRRAFSWIKFHKLAKIAQ